MNIGAEIVFAFLAIHQLSKSIDIAIALLVAVIGLVRQIYLHATLYSLGYAVRDDTLCKEKKETKQN